MIIATKRRHLIPILLACGLVAGCPNNDGVMEEAGETIDEALEDAGEALEDGAEKLEDAAEEMDDDTSDPEVKSAGE